ncbi:hypothetical protein Ddye_006583 [Dipteronia dyeriana]|uniref:F-box domain-containing protein n=1 Tax=Dipteronia dyeriana TaxID=168575 RepID=A0AAD9XIP7_9ROSI|nr:hypothetical protein Ddye_006583 [Dipteronia dyeriana]
MTRTSPVMSPTTSDGTPHFEPPHFEHNFSTPVYQHFESRRAENSDRVQREYVGSSNVQGNGSHGEGDVTSSKWVGEGQARGGDAALGMKVVGSGGTVVSKITCSCEQIMDFEGVGECNKGRDFISGLPNDILVQILSCLETKDVVKTSVLSSRWKNLWTFVYNLHFDDYDDKHCRSRNFENFQSLSMQRYSRFSSQL